MGFSKEDFRVLGSNHYWLAILSGHLFFFKGAKWIFPQVIGPTVYTKGPSNEWHTKRTITAITQLMHNYVGTIAQMEQVLPVIVCSSLQQRQSSLWSRFASCLPSLIYTLRFTWTHHKRWHPLLTLEVPITIAAIVCDNLRNTVLKSPLLIYIQLGSPELLHSLLPVKSMKQEEER